MIDSLELTKRFNACTLRNMDHVETSKARDLPSSEHLTSRGITNRSMCQKNLECVSNATITGASAPGQTLSPEKIICENITARIIVKIYLESASVNLI